MSYVPVRKNSRYGKLTVLDESIQVRSPNGSTNMRWKCRCDCGAEKFVRSDYLRSGKIVSCGKSGCKHGR